MLVLGEEVEGFEADLRHVLGVRHAVVMNSCTSTLEVALRALGLGPGDIVITSSYSWVATANVIELVGATPRFVDIDPATYNLEIASLQQLIEKVDAAGELDRVKALLPVHAFGYVADMPEILEIAERLGVPTVEDAACALGASLGGRPAGTMGQIGCFSFHPRKSVTSGEGGALVTDDDHVANVARAYRNHGQRPGATHVFESFGHNFRLTEPMAALARNQLGRLEELLDRRHSIVARYLTGLAGHVGLPAYDRQRHAVQAFVVVLPPDCEKDRVRSQMLEKGIETGSGTIAIPFTAAYATKYGYEPSEFPALSSLGSRALALPLHANLTSEDVDYVVTSLVETLNQG
jgi:dTDP-4-amino-4,6-dideoxygalactose transaminase